MCFCRKFHLIKFHTVTSVFPKLDEVLLKVGGSRNRRLGRCWAGPRRRGPFTVTLFRLGRAGPRALGGEGVIAFHNAFSPWERTNVTKFKIILTKLL